MPIDKYADGVGVGLGNGWDTSLTVDNTGLNDFSPSKIIRSAINHELTIRSTLKKTLTSTQGKMQGSAVMFVDFP
ncbi:hypothetical protein FNI87_16925 [Salmonella enterica subsp. salamae]|nr:hypothetical protein [Salmonella enterica subsp. salamae serovar Sofia]